jgi:hypothetical protein
MTLAGVTIVAPGNGQRIRGVMCEKIAAITATQGLSAFENPRRATCLQEAGHAVVSAGLLGRTGSPFPAARRDGPAGPPTPTRGGALVPVTRVHLIRSSHCLAISTPGYRQKRYLPETTAGPGHRSTKLLAPNMPLPWSPERTAPQVWRTQVHTPVCLHLMRHAKSARHIASYLLRHRKMRGRPLRSHCPGCGRELRRAYERSYGFAPGGTHTSRYSLYSLLANATQEPASRDANVVKVRRLRELQLRSLWD